MELQEAKSTFIQSWGSFGSQWGINRTMAQIHGLFLTSEVALSTEEVMEQLQISRGNANMNIRTLIDWGLLYREHKIGERKEYFIGEKDVWTIARRVIKMRHEKELIPMLRLLESIQEVKSGEDDEEETEKFKETVQQITDFANKADKMLVRVSNASESWFVRTFMKLFLK